jgi:hypothetical protein
MTKPFFERLRNYYLKVGEVLRGEASAAAIFLNTTDIGMERERVYAEFLRTHLPSSCNVLFGGFLFNLDGDESRQIDLIVTNDVSPQYNLNNEHGQAKTFACIEGCIAVASIKSVLDTAQLKDALDNIASLPKKRPLDNRVSPLINVLNYEEWPYKIIYASDGVSLETLLSGIEEFYKEYPDIPRYLRPNLIHVAGKYNVVRILPAGGQTRDGTRLPGDTFYPLNDPTDVFALQYAVQNIQQYAVASQYIHFKYDEILNNLPI